MFRLGINTEKGFEYVNLPVADEEIGKLEELEDNIINYDLDHPYANVSNILESLLNDEKVETLNLLAKRLEFLEHEQIDILNSAVEYENITSAFEIIKTSFLLDNYKTEYIYDEEDLGKMLVENCEYGDVSDELMDYIDLERLGEDYAKNKNGKFIDGFYIEKWNDNELKTDVTLKDLENYHECEIKDLDFGSDNLKM